MEGLKVSMWRGVSQLCGRPRELVRGGKKF